MAAYGYEDFVIRFRRRDAAGLRRHGPRCGWAARPRAPSSCRRNANWSAPCACSAALATSGSSERTDQEHTAQEVGAELATALLTGPVEDLFDTALRRADDGGCRPAPPALPRRHAGAARCPVGAAVPAPHVPRQPAPHAGRAVPRRRRARQPPAHRRHRADPRRRRQPPWSGAARRRRRAAAVLEQALAADGRRRRGRARLARPGDTPVAAPHAARRQLPRPALRRARRQPRRRERAGARGRPRRARLRVTHGPRQPARRPALALPRRASTRAAVPGRR